MLPEVDTLLSQLLTQQQDLQARQQQLDEQRSALLAEPRTLARSGPAAAAVLDPLLEQPGATGPAMAERARSHLLAAAFLLREAAVGVPPHPFATALNPDFVSLQTALALADIKA